MGFEGMRPNLPMTGRIVNAYANVCQVAWKLGIDVAWPNQFNRVRFPKL